jgi:hypothetical protein
MPHGPGILTMGAITKASQYPLERNATTDMIIDTVVSFRAADGTYTLRHELAKEERRALEARRNTVVDKLQPGRPGEILPALLEMLIGFGGAKQSVDEAKMIATQYAAVLSGLPTWAIKRACVRWAMGQVMPEEIDEKTINRSFPPSAAQVRVVAEAIVRPWMQEVARIKKTLIAKPESTVAEDIRAEAGPRVQAKAEAVKLSITDAIKADEARERERNQALTARSLETTDMLIRRQYEARGLTPYERNGTLVSLPMLLSMGWTIENNGIRDVLVAPAARRAQV